ncbi:MAG: hypothetical protein ACE5R4_17665 [Armatimonadota bacterium]
MKPQRKHSTALVLASALFCGAMVLSPIAGPTGWAQPAPVPEGGEPMEPEVLHHQLVQQLVGVWSQVAWGVAQDPMFLETPEAEALMTKAETLRMIRHEMWEALEPPGGPPGPEDNGRFQFVEWIVEGVNYWVLDTRTGEMHPREAPPLEE